MDASVMSESIQAVAPCGQSNSGLINPCTTQIVDVSVQALADRQAKFLQDVEHVVCAKITSLKLPERYGSPVAAVLTRENLYDKIQTPPWNMARQWVSYILRNHPLTQYNFFRMRKIFKRDHRTVMSGYSRIAIIVEDWRTAYFIDEFQDVCDALAELGYAHLRLWEVAGKSARPKRVEPSPLTRVGTYDEKTKQRYRNKQIVRRFNEGRTQRQLANEFNLRPNTIGKILRKNGVKPRSHAEAIRLGIHGK